MQRLTNVSVVEVEGGWTWSALVRYDEGHPTEVQSEKVYVSRDEVQEVVRNFSIFIEGLAVVNLAGE